MTVCRNCGSVEQGYKELSIAEALDLGYEYPEEGIKVCAVCNSEEIGEVNEDDLWQDR